jgi:hypothetical protein
MRRNTCRKDLTVSARIEFKERKLSAKLLNKKIRSCSKKRQEFLDEEEAMTRTQSKDP